MEIIYRLLAAVLIAAVPVLTGFICELFHKAAKEFKIKADNESKVLGSTYFCRWICSVMEDCPAKDAILMMG